MVTKKPKGLGRGLDVLLGPRATTNSIADLGFGDESPSTLELSELVPGTYQPRTRMDEGALYELAESIKAQGVLQPILVRRLTLGANAGKYEIIAGERRFRAAELAGFSSVPVLVRDVSDESAAAMALIENIQREDLNPLEQAQGLQRLVAEFGHTHEQAAQAVGRSRSATSNLLRLLQLVEPVQTMLLAGDLDMGHARALLALERVDQITAAQQITARKMTVREAERLVKRTLDEVAGAASKPASPAALKSADLRQLEDELSDLLAATVEFRIKSRGTKGRAGKPASQPGEMAIRFASLDELNGLIERIRRSR